MRIAVVCPYDLSVPGGVQGQVVGLAHALDRLGHDVSVIAPGALPPVLRGTSVGRAIGFRVNGSVAPMAPWPEAARRTIRALRTGAFDIVHLHEPLAPSITIPALVSGAAPIVATFHAAGDRTPYRWFGRPLSHLAERIDTRVAVSDAAAALARRWLGGSYDVLFDGIDLEPFRLGTPVEREPATVLFLGRHEPRKGLGTLLSASPLLPPDVTVWIAGHGPDTARLRDRHAGDSRLRWLGRVTDDERMHLLRSATVVCAPAIHGESFGIVLLEGMAAGAPVVASDLPGYRAVSDDGRSAHLVVPGDPRALAEGLARVLTDGAYAAALKARGVANVERFSMDDLARRYVALFERVRHAGVPA